MNAPEKIYLQVCGDCECNYCESCIFDEDNVTWSIDPIFKKDVEYIRTDAFIEKACEWLTIHDSYSTPTNVLVENFRKAMKGE